MHPQNRKCLIIRNLVLFFGFIALTSFTGIKKTSVVLVTPPLEIITVENSSIIFPYLSKDFNGFKEAVAFKESQGKYTVVNTLGYLGKYQFGKSTLQRVGVYNTSKFLRNPELQEKAFIALCKVNKWILRKDIKRYSGKTINGIKVTESGILAAAHLSGAGNVKKFLRSNGVNRFADAYGATIELYLKKFGGYDVSNINANRKAKV